EASRQYASGFEIRTLRNSTWDTRPGYSHSRAFSGFLFALIEINHGPLVFRRKRCLGGWVRDHGRAPLTLVASDRRVGNHHIADGYRDLDLVDATGKRPLGDSAKSADSI